MLQDPHSEFSVLLITTYHKRICKICMCLKLDVKKCKLSDTRTQLVDGIMYRVSAPNPSHVPAEGEQQRMLDIQECFKIPTVSHYDICYIIISI
jgi:hypothetical protein